MDGKATLKGSIEEGSKRKADSVRHSVLCALERKAGRIWRKYHKIICYDKIIAETLRVCIV